MPEVVLSTVQHKILVDDFRNYKVVAVQPKQKVILTEYDEFGTEKRIVSTEIDLNNAELKVNVLSQRNYIVVRQDTAAQIITVAQQGPAGVNGVAEKFAHNQTVSSNEWIVNHNMGTKPLVEVLSVGGESIIAEVQHVSDNQLRIYLSSPMQGQVICI